MKYCTRTYKIKFHVEKKEESFLNRVSKSTYNDLKVIIKAIPFVSCSDEDNKIHRVEPFTSSLLPHESFLLLVGVFELGRSYLVIRYLNYDIARVRVDSRVHM